METIFITGATGFIGNAILRQCAARNCKILAMSRNDDQDLLLKSIGAIPVRCNLDTVEAAQLEGVSTVIHAAGAVGPSYSPAQIMHINADLTIRLFRIAAEAGIKQFLYISSDTVVMNGKNQYNIDETATYSFFQHPYVKSKVFAEKFLSSQMDKVSMQIICLRPRLVWGSGDRLQLPLISNAVRSGNFWWIDKGNSQTSATFIGNLTHAISLIIGNISIPSGAYFIADGEHHTQMKFWNSLLATMGLYVPSKSLPKWMMMPIASAVEMIFRLFAPAKNPPLTKFSVAVFGTSFTMNCHKAFTAFGYRPIFSFEQGLATMKNE